MVLVLLVVLIVGFVAAFILSFAMGANDVANSFGTSVGSKVLTLKQAVVVAAIFETLGSVLVGYHVTDTVRKGIVDISIYDTQARAIQLAFGALATLASTCLWLLIATWRKFPVSASHAIVGATLGFTLVMHGTDGVKWKVLGFIALSWIVSPLMAGGMSALLFSIIRKSILRRDDPITPGLRALPIIFAVTIFINVLAILLNGSKLLHLDNVPVWMALLVAGGIAGIVMALVAVFVVPYLRRRMANSEVHEIVPEKVITEQHEKVEANLALDTAMTNGKKNSQFLQDETSLAPLAATNGKIISNEPKLLENDVDAEIGDHHHDDDDTLEKQQPVVEASAAAACPASVARTAAEAEKTKSLFSFVQVMTACCASFAHGGNDVSNAIGPLVTIWLIYESGGIDTQLDTPLWILLFGGIGISIGLLALGRRVIETIGEDLTSTMTPSSGFCIELGTVTTVLLASKLGVPISTTHCIVGSVIAVGLLRCRKTVNVKLLRGIVFAWIVTLPATICFSAAIMWAFRVTLPYF